jgi:hypothetical protein
MANPVDRLNWPLGVLRLSLTARCNLACHYCLPDGVEPPGLLTLEQLLRVIAAAVSLGVRSLRLSAERARILRAAGLDRITLSLDGSTGASVARMAGVGGADPQEQARRGPACSRLRAAGLTFVPGWPWTPRKRTSARRSPAAGSTAPTAGARSVNTH